MKLNFHLSVFILVLSILACGFPSASPEVPTVNPLPPTPNLPFSPTTAAATVPPPAAPFSGVWQGPDSDDGSAVTVTLSQTDGNLTGNFKDTFSGNIPPPGFEGGGSGSTLSPTTAQMTFNLTRSDGKSATIQFNLELTNGNNTLTLSPVGSPQIILQRTQ
jgi:hypothetical protein